MAAAARCLLSTASRTLSLDGMFIPLTTPFSVTSRDIDYEKLNFNLYKYKDVPFAGYVVAGSNGEAPYLRPEERVEIVKRVRQTVDRTKSVIGGATHESTKGACELSRAMANVGADGVLVMPPFYFKKRMTNEAILNHYMKLADESPIPIVIYNMPFVTGIDIPISVLAKLAHHPNIRGVKDGDVRKLAGIVMATKGIGLEFDVLAGSVGYLLPAIQVGCSGGINGLAGALGKQCCDLYTLSRERKWEEALKLHLQLTRIDTLLMSDLGVPGLKAAMDIMGLYGGPCREPMLPSSVEDIERIKSTLKQDNLI
ncbi:4-hydroxy-2-oxoglutarate aldolase, mitochondrial-like [Macrosteles quadrilineatus]|uniref:4-hydroxy-2-oxoglutarate aldolase, mitochondrial-like n=1 Tax=Macrosteles quadrilineatus TaxID=74068 RepID=UPI0023E290D6|nr:4-hydroxy-2-oxoglutarate aldolase, mitochondrial-like [Macrosteles quadrilineatus]